MKHATLRRRIAVLVLGLMLVAPGVWAAPLAKTAAAEEPLLLRLWLHLGALWDAIGSNIDPDGNYGVGFGAGESTQVEATDTSDIGSNIDPWGGK